MSCSGSGFVPGGPSSGPASAAQLLGQRNITRIYPNAGSSSVGVDGSAAVTLLGTTARAFANTNIFTGARRVGFVSAAAAGERAGYYTSTVNWWRGNAALAGGFRMIWRFGISDAVLNPGARMLCGMNATGAIFTDVDPSTLTNVLGIGHDAGDTAMQLYAAGAVAQPRTSLGANFPVNTVNVDIYELDLFCPPNANFIDYAVTRLNTGARTSGQITAAAQLPANNIALDHRLWRTTGAVATAVGVDLFGMYGDSDI